MEEEAGATAADKEEAKVEGSNGESEGLPPSFSCVFDKRGCDCQVLTKCWIDSIVCNKKIVHRKQVVAAKLRGLKAETPKMDFNCETANKIHA